MICLNKMYKSGVESAPLFTKVKTKNILPAGQKGFRNFSLNSKMVSKHQAGEYWALKNALNIRGKINLPLKLYATLC
jgi:hypothetical protein